MLILQGRSEKKTLKAPVFILKIKILPVVPCFFAEKCLFLPVFSSLKEPERIATLHGHMYQAKLYSTVYKTPIPCNTHVTLQGTLGVLQITFIHPIHPIQYTQFLSVHPNIDTHKNSFQ